MATDDSDGGTAHAFAVGETLASPGVETAAVSPMDATAPAPPQGELPSKVGRFIVEAKLGSGGMGTVLLATDPLLERKVALKLLHREDRDDARRRFVREAQAMAKVSHENIIVVHEVGTDGGRVYIAMELIAGGTLRRWQARKAWKDIVATYVRAGRGLEAAHAAGLVHRDFKPDNVLVDTDGKVRVTDFGLVAAVGAVTRDPGSRSELDVSLTQSGAILGTPRYMAAEQHQGDPIDARADQFAFCVALYEALYGQPPFAGETVALLVTNVLEGTVRPPPASDVPTHVREAVLRGLACDREVRFPSMRELLAALQHEPAVARPGRRWLWAAAGLGVAAIVGVVVLAISMRDDAARARERTEELDRELVSLKNRPLEPSTDPATKAEAQRLFKLAQEAYVEQRYDDAALGFLDTYTRSRYPQFLYNVGAAFQMAGKQRKDPKAYRKAIEYYRRYLEDDPKASDRATVLRAIGVLETEIERSTASPEKPK